LQNAKAPANVAFLKQWADYVKAKNVPFKADVAIDPMVSAYDAVHLWAMAAAKANSFDVPEVRKAFAGLSFDCPSGYKLAMTAENNYVSRGVFIGSVNEKQGFDILWQSKDAAKPVPFSPYG
jgi:urea transport system substrate-binding protein